MCGPAAISAVPDTGFTSRILTPPRTTVKDELQGKCKQLQQIKLTHSSTREIQTQYIRQYQKRNPTYEISTTQEVQKVANFDSEKFHFQKGTTLRKKTKYSVSSNYYHTANPEGHRITYPKTGTINIKYQSNSCKKYTSTWVLLQRDNLRPRSKRLINPKQLIPNHTVLRAPKTWQWQTAIPLYQPKLFNYFQPLTEFTHGIEPKMTTNNVKAAVSIRSNMVKLRTGTQQRQQTTIAFTNGARDNSRPLRGGRGGGRGRSPQPQQSRIATLFAKQTSSMVSVSTSESSPMPTTVSDITESTTNTDGSKPAAMEITNTTKGTMQLETEDRDDYNINDEEEEGLTPILLTGTPQTIPNFKPNKQWVRDTELGEQKTKYGIEIKIDPKTKAKSESDPPAYNHIRIFKAIVSAILTAAPTTIIHSIDDNEEAIDNVEDIPTTK
jgi:hypothetical protein